MRGSKAALAATSVCGVLCFAAEWGAFRGPNGSGMATGAKIFDSFGPGENVLWKMAVPAGSSSPVVAGRAVFLTGFAGGELLTLKIDGGTGRTIWKKAVAHTRSETRHKLNNAASPSPATDGENVYSFFSDFGLISYDGDGRERWRLEMAAFTSLHGMGASPVVVGDRVILVCDSDGDSFVMAVGKDTGKVLWKTMRPAAVHGYATPVVFDGGGERQLIVPGSYFLAAYAVSDGREVWTVRGLSWQIKASAVVSGDTVFATGWAPGADPGEAKPLPGFGEAVAAADADKDGKLANAELPAAWKHGGSWWAIDLDKDGGLNEREWGFYKARREASNVTMAVRPGKARGDLTGTHMVWKHQRMVPEVPTPLLLNGVLYTVRTGGILTSMDAGTGEILKSARVAGATGAYYASPIVVGDRILILSEEGKVGVVKAGGQWETLRVNDFDEAIYATPAVGERAMYLRTASALYAFAVAR